MTKRVLYVNLVTLRRVHARDTVFLCPPLHYKRDNRNTLARFASRLGYP